MNEENKPTGATSTNPAAAAHAPRQAVPVMDVTPPPAAPVQPAPVEQNSDIPPVSEEIARQIGGETAIPPAELAPPPAASEPAAGQPPVAVAPAEEQAAPAAPEGPTDIIQQELHHQQDQPAQAAPTHESNPAQTAIIITLVVMVLLSVLAVFAYLSTQ